MAEFALDRKVAQDYLQSKRTFNGQSVVYSVPPFLNGLVSPNGAMLASEDQVAAAIRQNDPQGYQAVVQNIPETMDRASISGNTINYTEAPDEGFGEDWLAPVMMIAGYGAAGAMNGAFSGVPGVEGAGANLSSVGGSGGLNDVMGSGFNPGSAGADASWGATTGNMMPPAQAPSAAQYAEWGMKEVAPGTWTQGGAAPGAWQTAMASAGVPASTIGSVASNVAKGFGLKEAMQLAGLAAPVIGSLLSSGAVKDAVGAQQQATDAGISRIEANTPAALETIRRAQETGAAGQNEALSATLAALQKNYDEGVVRQDAATAETIGDLRRQYDEGVTEQRGAFDTARTNLKPYTDAGANAVRTLDAGVAPGGDLVRRFSQSDLEADPVYNNGLKFGLDQGKDAINARSLMAGNYDSGATLKALTRFGNDYGTTKAEGSYNRFTGDQNNTYNRLMGVTNVGQNATNAENTLGFNTASNIANQGNSMATTVGNFRDNNASRIAGQGNALATTAGGFRTGTANSIATGLNTSATNDANIRIGANNNIVQLLTGMGNARGAASIATGNNFSNAATGVGNYLTGSATLDRILAANRR